MVTFFARELTKVNQATSGSVGSVDFRIGGRWLEPLCRPKFSQRTDDSHCDRIHFCPTAVRCFDNGYVGKQPMTILRTKSVTKKEMNKCMAEIYDPSGIRTRAARLISQYHNH